MRPGILLLLALPLSAAAQQQVCVRDSQGANVAGTSISVAAVRIAITGNDGCATVDLTNGTIITVQAEGFAIVSATVQDHTDIILAAASARENVLVMATRTPLSLEANASEITLLNPQELQDTPGFALDDQLRQATGFQLYRRSSSWASNPTSQGLSLRGLGSTAASRTLVLSDEVPLNDPGGGWVRWNEIPAPAIAGVELARGGGSDLYGSSAMGGVINIFPVLPQNTDYAVDTYGGSLGTYAASTLGKLQRERWSSLLAAGVFHTDGYIPVPEPYRGSVDADDNDHSQNGRAEVRYTAPQAMLFLRGNVLNDTRQNGTVLQNNAARIWRYAGGGDDNVLGGELRVRLFGTEEGYRQSFSAISADRDSETLTRLQRFPIQELGATALWTRPIGRKLTFIAGADTRDIRGDDVETSVSTGVRTSTTARQRDTGAYAELLYLPRSWSIALSGRVDRYSTFDANQYSTGVPPYTALPSLGATVFDPRLGVVRTLTPRLSLSASAFRAFRGPTLNELYRTGQVGSEITKPNPNLTPERATGVDAGVRLDLGSAGALRATWFWTEVNRPITAVLISGSSSSIIEMRENLGQLRSRGVSLDYDATPVSWLRITAGYQYADATVTQFSANPALVGTWVPQVARNMFSAVAQAHQRTLGTFTLATYAGGHAYDDSGNTYELHQYLRVDAQYSRTLFHSWEFHADAQNLLDRSIEVARTPVLSLGTPQTFSVGLRKNLAR